MAKVNSDVQEVVDSTHYAVQGAIDLWNILPVFIQVLICTLIVTSLLMQFIKKTALYKYSKTKKIRYLWRWGMAIGIAVTGAAYGLFDGGLIHKGLWALIGVAVSSIAMAVHFVSVKLVFPILMVIYGELADRAYLMATKKPRPKAKP